MRALILLIPCLLFTETTSAQGTYLERGQNGFGVLADYQATENVRSAGIGVGYSFNGTFDVGIGVQRSTFDEDDLGYDLTGNGLTLSATAHVFKQREGLPLNVAIGGSGAFMSYASDDLDELNVDLGGSSYGGGATLYSVLGSEGGAQFVPFAGIVHERTRLEAESGGISIDETFDNTYFSVGVDLLIATSRMSKFFAGPSLSIDDEGNTAWGIGIGLVVSRDARLR